MKRVFDSPFLNKAALVLIWLLLMGGTFFYANKNYFLYHENPNLIKADGYYLYNFGSPRHYYWALPVKFTHEGKVYHSQLPLDIRDESSSCTVDLRIYIPADSSCKLCLNGMPVPLLRNGYSIFNGTKYR